MNVVKPAAFNADQRCVDLLEDLLAKAKAGEITEITAVYQKLDMTRMHTWTGCEDLYSLLGYVTAMQYTVQRRIRGES